MAIRFLTAAVLAALAMTPAAAQESATNIDPALQPVGLGGPQSAGSQQAADAARRRLLSRNPDFDAVFNPVEDALDRLDEVIGLNLSFDYQALYQIATDGLAGADDDGAAGHARLLGRWTMFDRDGSNPGTLVFILENRHQIGGGVTPSDLAGAIAMRASPGSASAIPATRFRCFTGSRRWPAVAPVLSPGGSIRVIFLTFSATLTSGPPSRILRS